MYLIRTIAVAVLSSTMATTFVAAQTIPNRTNRPSGIRPFVALSIGPSNTNTESYRKSARPVPELSVGARKRLTQSFGVVASVYAGKTINEVLGGEDAYCRVMVVDGKSGPCLPHVPLLDWYGAAVGAEAYVGRAILSLSAGPASFGTKAYERYPQIMSEPTRGLGVRTQFEAILPVYRSVGLSMSAAHRTIPSLLADRMSVTSFGLGIVLR